MTIKILSGNELIVQGGLEAGFSLYTGYPGSPLADFFNILHQMKGELQAKGIKVVLANSEANAAAMASGAKMAGQNTLVGMKSMGLHVAADALSVGNFADPGPKWSDSQGQELSPGVVIVVGDDPWSISTSTPADSRYLFKHLHIPFLEPSTPQELKDWLAQALHISQLSSVYVGVLLTTAMAEGGGRVQVGELKTVAMDAVVLDPSTFNLQKNVMVPPNSLLADQEMIQKRFPLVSKAYALKNLDQFHGATIAQLGFISAGVVAETLKQILDEEQLLQHFSYFKLASSYPLVPELLLPFLQKLQVLVVVEEKRGFLETELTAFCQEHRLRPLILGKKFFTQEGFPCFGGLSYEIIHKKLQELFPLLQQNGSIIPIDDRYLATVLERPNLPEQKLQLSLPKRLPTFCPGCPHRETLSLLKEIRLELAAKNIQLISHGDVGCYSLSFLEPFKEMHDLSAMGQGGALGAGTDIFTQNPAVVLMGDSTFFHSGMSAISNSLQLGHNITYILLDNDNTAMTGHQVTPTTGLNVEGEVRPRQEMLEIVRGMGVKKLIEVNPSDRYFYKNLLLQYVQDEGLKVIISNKECALTFHGRQKKRERELFAQGQVQPVRQFYQINTEACEDCRMCVEMTGCPGLAQTFDAYGSKVIIDPAICVADSYCTKIKVCPSFELVEVFNYHPTQYLPQALATGTVNGKASALPDPIPSISLEEIASGKDFRMVVTGVGGSGVTTISRVLAQAASTMGGREDIDFKFFEQKGLAQRNGSVTGHLALFKKGKSHGTITASKTAHLVLSPDLLEGSRSLHFLAPQGWGVFDSQFQIPLSLLLDRASTQEALSEEELQSRLLQEYGGALYLVPLRKISFHFYRKAYFASAIILGILYQAGKLPFTLEDLLVALKRAVPKAEVEDNLQAFTLGREYFYLGAEGFLLRYPQVGQPENALEAMALLRSSLQESFLPWQRSASYLQKYDGALAQLSAHFPHMKPEYLAQYVHDLFIYDRGAYIEEFLQNSIKIKNSYKDSQLQQMALRVLARTYFFKDEVFVSHILLSPMRRKKDADQYQYVGSSYKITNINRPQFILWGKKIEFDLHPKKWMLRLMRQQRFLRPLLPQWHQQDRQIARSVRHDLLHTIVQLSPAAMYSELKKRENIKGYRQVRYQSAEHLKGATA